MPTVVFDVRANHDTGVSRYGLSLLATAAPLAVRAGWRLLSVAQPIQEERARAATAGLGVPVVTCPHEEGFVRRAPWLRDLLVEQDADLYFTSHYLPDRRCPVPFVFTIHDLTRLRFPELSYSDASFAERFGVGEMDLLRRELAELSAWDQSEDGDGLFTRYFRTINRHLVQRAERLITVSRSTASDVAGILGVDAARLDLVPCAVDGGVFHRRDVTAVQAVRRHYGLAGPYLMFVGLVHPNKRFPWLVEQLVRARHRFPADARLVAVGGHAEQTREVHRLLWRHDATDFVVFAGRVCDGDLAALYSGAAALVTASINEGSSLPPMEAMACGCQVIATDIPALRESLGRGATLFDPARADQFADLAEAALRGRLPDHASIFRPLEWRASGHRLVHALGKALAGTAGAAVERTDAAPDCVTTPTTPSGFVHSRPA